MKTSHIGMDGGLTGSILGFQCILPLGVILKKSSEIHNSSGGKLGIMMHLKLVKNNYQQKVDSM